MTDRHKDQTAISSPNVFGFVCPTTLAGEVNISKPWCGLDNRMQVRSGLHARLGLRIHPPEVIHGRETRRDREGRPPSPAPEAQLEARTRKSSPPPSGR